MTLRKLLVHLATCIVLACPVGCVGDDMGGEGAAPCARISAVTANPSEVPRWAAVDLTACPEGDAAPRTVRFAFPGADSVEADAALDLEGGCLLAEDHAAPAVRGPWAALVLRDQVVEDVVTSEDVLADVTDVSGLTYALVDGAWVELLPSVPACAPFAG